MTARKTHIVTADDDPQLLRLIARNLEFEGYEVVTASDGAIALEQIERSTPDLVMLDVMMPKMDGFISVEELLARVRAALRRSQLFSNDLAPGRATTAVIGALAIDYAQHLVTLSGKELTLTPTEYRLLAYLAQNVGRVVTQDLLLEHVWGEDYLGESHMLQVNVNRIRHKLEMDPAHPQYLKTKVGIGYLLTVPIQTEEAD